MMRPGGAFRIVVSNAARKRREARGQPREAAGAPPWGAVAGNGTGI